MRCTSRASAAALCAGAVVAAAGGCGPFYPWAKPGAEPRQIFGIGVGAGSPWVVSDGRIDSGSQIGAHYTFWATRRAAIEFAGGGRRFTDRDVGGELAVASWTVSLLRSYPTVLEPPGKKPRDVFRWWWGLGAGEATLSHSAATLTESVRVSTGRPVSGSTMW